LAAGAHFQLFLYPLADWAGAGRGQCFGSGRLTTPSAKLEFLTFMLSESIVNGHKPRIFSHAKSLEEFFIRNLAQDVASAPIV